MDWIVPIGETERRAGALSQESTRAIYSSLHANGAVLLRGAFAAEAVDALHEEFMRRFGALDAQAMAAKAASPGANPILQVGPSRFDIVLAMTGAFADPKIFASPLLNRLLVPVLAADMRLGGFTAVLSYPGAEAQAVHRDHSHLFGQPGVAPNLPVYALNIAVPLIDIDLETGPTAIWLGSHRWPEPVQAPPDAATVTPFLRGDCILFDYRTLHSGLPNRSARPRPILYMPYMRTWFADDVNHARRAPLDMTLETYESLPDDARSLLLRAYSLTMRARLAPGTGTV